MQCVFREVWEWKAAVSVLSDLLWLLTGRWPAVFLFQENSRVVDQIFIRTRDVTRRFKLNPGTYAIVPAAKDEQEFKFLLRIFIKNQDCNE